MSCDIKTLRLWRGYPSDWNDENWLTVDFDSEILITGFGARFELGGITKNYTNVESGFNVSLSAAETQTLSTGLLNASIILIDTDGNDRPVATDIPVVVSDWASGDIEIDGFDYTLNIDVEENELNVHIYSASPSQEVEELIDEKISEHNTSTTAHSDIRTLVANEVSARTSADNTLQANIDSEESSREDADAVLQNNINSEAQTRAAADTTLTNNLNTEIATRENADTVLANAIDEKQDTIDSDNKLSSDLVDDTNHTNKFVTASQITSWTNKVSATYNSTNEEITFA